jgi:hypothetical protein
MRQGRQGMCRVYEPMPHVGVGDGLASLQIVCAWCQQPLRRQPVQTPTRFTISYSICARCYEDVARESEDTTGSGYLPAASKRYISGFACVLWQSSCSAYKNELT